MNNKIILNNKSATNNDRKPIAKPVKNPIVKSIKNFLIQLKNLAISHKVIC